MLHVLYIIINISCPRKRIKNRECHATSLTGLVCLFFVALRPKSTAMVIAGRSVHLTTLFPGQA